MFVGIIHPVDVGTVPTWPYRHAPVGNGRRCPVRVHRLHRCKPITRPTAPRSRRKDRTKIPRATYRSSSPPAIPRLGFGADAEGTSSHPFRGDRPPTGDGGSDRRGRHRPPAGFDRTRNERPALEPSTIAVPARTVPPRRRHQPPRGPALPVPPVGRSSKIRNEGRATSCDTPCIHDGPIRVDGEGLGRARACGNHLRSESGLMCVTLTTQRNQLRQAGVCL